MKDGMIILTKTHRFIHSLSTNANHHLEPRPAVDHERQALVHQDWWWFRKNQHKETTRELSIDALFDTGFSSRVTRPHIRAQPMPLDNDFIVLAFVVRP